MKTKIGIIKSKPSCLYDRILFFLQKITDVEIVKDDFSFENIKFVLCPVITEKDELYVYKVIKRGAVPVIVSDSYILRYENNFDYSKFSFRIGANPAEILSLENLLLITDYNYNRIVCEGQKFLESIEIKNFKTSKQRIIKFKDYPVMDNEGCLLSDRNLFIAFWKYLGVQYTKDGDRKIIIYGAGKFLKRLYSYVANIVDGPNILGVVDDSATEKIDTEYYSIYPPTFFTQQDFSTVLIATDTIFDLLAEKCKKTYGNNVDILNYKEIVKITDSKVNIKPEEFFDVSFVSNKKELQVKQKLQGIVVCVGYSDFLSWTLPYNIENFDKFVVVTSSEDIKTQEIAEKYGAELAISDCYKDNGNPFNKGKMLNVGFSKLDPNSWVLLTDADVLFRKHLQKRLFSRLLNTDFLYYALRLNTPSMNREKWIKSYYSNELVAEQLRFSNPSEERMPWGYFQLFHPSASCLAKFANNNYYSENYPTAGEVDYVFQEQWKNEYKILLPETVIHIEHGSLGTNWKGRKSVLIQKKKI